MSRYPVAGPSITALELEYVTDAVQNGWYDDATTWIRRFEESFAAHTGRSRAAALPSCTSGLHLVLSALGIGPGDEVVVPEATWIASSAPISYVGATPVFADIDRASWCLSAQTLEACLSSRTRAVIVVDLYGGMPQWDEVLNVADRAGIAVIEDAAEAVGATWRGRPAGSFGTASVFSFHGSKTLTTGEGGMVLTDDDALMERVNVLRDHGRALGDVAFFNQEVGFKYKMSALQAALGCAQLERLDELVTLKRTIFSWYEERLREIPEVSLNPVLDEVASSYWMVTALVAGHEKEKLAQALEPHGVVTRPFFHPLGDLPAYRETGQAKDARSRNHVVRSISPYAINLPSAMRLDESEVEAVCRHLVNALRG